LLLVAASLPPLLAGLWIGQVLLQDFRHATPWLLIGLAPGLGFAVTSCLFFAYAVLFGPRSHFQAYALAEFVVVAAFLVPAVMRTNHIPMLLRLPCRGQPHLFYVLVVGLALAIGLAVASFLSTAMWAPHGGWDAWSIWNLRARFVFLGGRDWAAGFSPVIYWSHPDYPLLLPMSSARLWFYVGRVAGFVPLLLAAVFTFSSVAVLSGALLELQLVPQAILAAFTLMATPFFVYTGAIQYADVPLSLFILAAVVLYYMHGAHAGAASMRLLVLLGVMLGAAAWTKNEGLAVLASFCVIWLTFELFVRRTPPREFLKSSAYLGLGIIPFLVCLSILKLHLAPPTDLFSSRSSAELIQKITDPSRYAMITSAVLHGLTEFGGWKIPVLPWLLILVPLLGMRKLTRSEAVSTISGAALLLLLGAVYVAIYVTTPNDLNWHLSTSLSRLILHGFPSFLFLFFAVVHVPYIQPQPATSSASNLSGPAATDST
jgi:hypothetical protein